MRTMLDSTLCLKVQMDSLAGQALRRESEHRKTACLSTQWRGPLHFPSRVVIFLLLNVYFITVCHYITALIHTERF